MPSPWRLFVNDREVPASSFTVAEADGGFRLHVLDQCLVAGEVTTRVDWARRVIRVTGARDQLQAMARAIDLGPKT